MKIIKISKNDLDSENFYKNECVDYYNDYQDVNVEIDENLGWVRFKKGLYVNGYIEAKAGSGIEAGSGMYEV